MQMPSGAAPSFMILAELQHRQRLRAGSQGQQAAEQGQTTVADHTLRNAIQSMMRTPALGPPPPPGMTPVSMGSVLSGHGHDAARQHPWMVQVHGNDVNWEYFPRTDDFSQEFADLEDALPYANGEDDSYFAQTTVPAKR